MQSLSTVRTVAFGPLILTLLAVLAFLCAGHAVTPPALRAVTGPDRFDAVAAQARLARVLGDEIPHPIDSAAQDELRARLLGEIEALGLAGEVRETFACRPHPSNPLIDCMMVRNIVFAIGPDEGPVVLAATHYDSVPAGPGASDAGIGIAAWLEVARVLSRARLMRRVVFVFTDGEEIALMGAHVFAAQAAEMQAAEALVNLEARGTRGPAIFFETNQPNGDAIAAFSGVPRGMANSVSADVYALLPNDTDVTELRREGLDVINLALLDGLEDYHTPQDALASQDPRSLQHMGDAALYLIRRLAGAADQGDTREMVYADIAGRVFLSAPSAFGQGALALSALIAAGVFWRTGRDGRWRALAAPVVALAIGGVASFVVLYAFTALRGGAEFWMAYPLAARAWCVMLGVLALLASMWVLEQRNAAQTGAAMMLWFALIGLGLTLITPGISIMFAPPALAYAAFAVVALLWPPARAIGAGVAALLAVAMWAPWLYLVELALGFGLAFVNTILVVLALAPACGALVAAQGAARWRGTSAIVAAATVLAIGVAASLPSYSSARPLSLNLNVVSDAVVGETFVTAGPARRALPRALAQAAPFTPRRVLPGDRAESWAARVESTPVARPGLEEVRIDSEGGARVWRARLRTNGAYRVMVRIPRVASPLSASINGVATRFDAAGLGGDVVTLACQGRSCDGAELAVTLAAGGETAPWFLIGLFPNTTTPASRALIGQRGDAATPYQFGDSVITLDAIAQGD